MFLSRDILGKRPLLTVFALFTSGIVSARCIDTPFGILLAICFFLFLFFLLFKNRSSRLQSYLLAALVFLLGVSSYANSNTLPADHISLLLKPLGQRSYVRGVIKSLPVYKWQKWGKRSCEFLLDIGAYKKGGTWTGSSGLSKARIKDNEIEYSYGDEVLVLGRLKPVSSIRTDNGFDYAGYLKKKGIYTLVYIDSDDDITAVKRQAPYSLKRFIHKIRYNAERRFKSYLPYPDYSIISAMLIARRHLLPAEVKELFVKTGTMHILSVSGLHVAIISAILFFLLETLLRLPRKISSLMVIIFLAFYVVIAEERTPILRASIMIAIYLISYMLNRDFDIYAALSLAGIAILIVKPMQAFTAGFILSFSCIFSLAYLVPKFEALFAPCIRDRAAPSLKAYALRILAYAKSLLCASLAVFIGVWPIIASYFKVISPVAIIYNLLVIPLLGVIIFLGIILACLPVCLKQLAVICSFLLHILLTLILKSASFLSGFWFAYFYISGIPFYVIAFYYLLLYIAARRFLSRNMR